MRRMLVLLLAGLILASPAWCGTGSYIAGDPDLIQLNVRFHNFKEQNTTTWEPLFKAASRLLFDATEKQVKISRVTFDNRCPGTANRADIKIYNDRMEALVNPLLLDLDKPGFGATNASMRLSQLHKTVGTANARGEVGLVHEIGHYVFGLRDEYLDKNRHRSNSAGCASRAHDDIGFNPKASLMDSGTIERTNVRTEFCDASNHRTGQTSQDVKRKIGNLEFENADSWTLLAAWAREHYGVTLRSPSAPPSSDISGFEGEPEFVTAACGGLRLAVGIDSSEGVRAFRAPGAAGVPSSGAPVDVAKEGSRTLIQLLEEDDSVGIAVGGEPDAVPIRTMSTENRSRALSQIRRFRGRGRTGWAEALQESFRQIGGAESPAGNKAVVLIADGSRDGVETPDALLSTARRRGVIVHTIGVGKESTELRRIAERTGGRYRLARNAAQVNANLLSVLADLKNRGILAAEEGRIEPGETLSIAVHVDAATTAQTADFLLAWSDPGPDLGMTLEGPDRKIVSSDMKDAIFQENFDGELKRYRIRSPTPGTWKVTLTNPSASFRDFAFQAHTWTDEVVVTGEAVDDVVNVAEPLILKAEVFTHLPVSGAKVTARIERPGGTPVPLQLFDDGSPEHQDELANDGAYSNVFEDYTGSGTYTVDLTVDSEGGRTAHPEDADFVSEPVNRFVRKLRFSAMVKEDPDE